MFGVGKYIRKLRPPIPPKNSDGKILIHVGCGQFDDKRYLNMDTRPGKHIHVVDTIENIAGVFPADYADLIYACHILEHIPYAKVPGVLAGVKTVLKKGGVFRISVPNFAVIVRMYQQKHKLEDVLAPLMGGQGYSDNFHYTAFDKASLTKLLLAAGFSHVRLWDPKTAEFYSFDDWAGRTFPLYGKSWPISLNIEAVK